jgi:predicted AAA+ superfamily ATPase
MMESVDQTLAGRVGILRLLPFSHSELVNGGIAPGSVDEEIFQGGYPRIYDKQIHPTDYYPNYISTYVERDVRQVKSITDLSLFVKFIKLCAGRIGQLLNKTSLAIECGVSAPTIAAWLSVLEQSYVIYQLQPSYKNFNKRLVKTPKIYFFDTGLACSLLDIRSAEQVSTHYLRGGLFENMVINEIMKSRLNQGIQPDLAFWRDSNGNEVDLILTEATEQFAYEIKSGATPTRDFFKGLKYWSSLSGADSEHCSVVYGGTESRIYSYGRLIPWGKL